MDGNCLKQPLQMPSPQHALLSCAGALALGFFGALAVCRTSESKGERLTDRHGWVTTPPKPIFSEQMTTDQAEAILLDQTQDRGQRNEAANRIRDESARDFMRHADTILNDPSETDLFKSWILQHIGVLGPKLDSTVASAWATRIKDIVAAAPVGEPVWREAIFALSSFQNEQSRAWLLEYIRLLPSHDQQKNSDILDEIAARLLAREPTMGNGVWL